MDTDLKTKIDLFVQNSRSVGDAFVYEYGLNCLVSGLAQSIQEAGACLDKKAFGYFRGERPMSLKRADPGQEGGQLQGA